MKSLPDFNLDQLDLGLLQLPPLPSSVRYWDDYSETFHTIRNLSTMDDWIVIDDGREIVLSFSYLPNAYRLVAKLVAVEMLSRLDTTSVLINLGRLQALALRFGPMRLMGALITLPPHRLREEWENSIKPNCSYDEASKLKSIMHSICILSIGPWSLSLREYVSKFPTQKQNAYKAVRLGDCFVPINHQSIIVDYFDEMASLVEISPKQIKTTVLRDICILVISHQHALRNGQIAKIKFVDVRTYSSGAVHFAFPVTKQRRTQNMRRVTRRIKREWCPLFVEFELRRQHITVPIGTPDSSYFLLKPDEVGSHVRRLVRDLTGEAWSTSDLRHTAAQRQTDTGMSHLALAEFMTHANIRTGNVYFDTSPTQAQRVNLALALSPIYANVAEVARTRTIDKTTLLCLPEDKQVGGMPHGIPISGIGGCTSGQSNCTKNPILSCYICRKFMPVKDASIHESVVESLRPVVLEFDDASRSNEENPAFLQLSRTLTAAMQVADKIKAGEDVTVAQEEMQSYE